MSFANPAEVRQQSDQLITGAFAEGNGSRLTALKIGAAALEQTVADCWDYPSNYLVEGLRAAVVLACMPSLETIASSRSHDTDVAQASFANFQQLAGAILDRPSLSNPYALHYDKDLKNHVRGQLSEIGVLGMLWWSIAAGRRDSQSFALPATRAEDSGRYKDEYNLGADIVMRQNGSRKAKQLIQVKTDRQAAHNKSKHYYPGIAVVALTDILGHEQSQELPIRLLRTLTSGKEGQLDDINQRIDTRIRKAREAAEFYKAFKAREAARRPK